jgi:aminomethyltransferase
MNKTPLNAWHRSHGASMTDFGGWDMPVSYGPIADEHKAVREAAGLFDISHMGQVWVRGARALEFLQAHTTNDVAALGDGRMQYSLLPAMDGGLYDDIIVTRLAAGEFYVVVNASNAEADVAWLKACSGPFGVEVSAWDGQAMLALQGPRAQALLQPLVAAPLAPLKYYHLRRDKLAGVDALVSRSGYTGEDGFELSLPAPAVEGVWEALLQAGAKPIGLGARNTLRLEMAYALFGHEIERHSNAYEAGLGWVVKAEKKDFVGKAPMLAVKAAGLKRRLAGFELLDRGVARDGYAVVDASGKAIGKVASGGPSPTLGNKCVGLAYVPVELAAPGSEILIDVRGRHLKARVIKTPFVESHVLKN